MSNQYQEVTVKFFRSLSFACSFTLVLAATLLAGEYTVDPVHSDVEFTIRYMITNVNGRFKEFSGTVSYEPTAPDKLAADIEVKSSSITTDNERRDTHLRSIDFFSADSFPTLSFRSVRAFMKDQQTFLEGDLTMRGVTRRVTVPVNLLGEMESGDRIVAGFATTFKVDRKDYGILWNRTLDAGGLLLGNEVTIRIQLAARKVKEAN
jgi:polyisoprenoid-binding protein YceI